MSLDALKTKARKATLNGKYDVALKCYLDIHKEDPSDLRIFTKVAEMKEKTGDIGGAIKSYTAIAKAYADDGFVVQAIAINKLILRLDPEQTEIKERLKDLSTERGDDWAITTVISQVSSPEMTGKGSKLGFERTPLLSGLAGQELDDFIESLELKEVPEGEAVYQANDKDETLYLIGMGSVRLETKNTKGKQQIFSHLSEGDFFGELAFMSKQPHIDTAIAESDTNLLLISRKVFDEWVKKYPSINDTLDDFYRRRVLARILAITPVFEGIPQEAHIALAKQFTSSSFKKGETIIQEGEVGDTFFLIRGGKVSVSIQNKKDTSQTIQLDTLSEGSFFGEVSMLTKRPRTASVHAASDVELLVLNLENFDRIAKKFPSVLKVVESYLKARVKSTIQTLKGS